MRGETRLINACAARRSLHVLRWTRRRTRIRATQQQPRKGPVRMKLPVLPVYYYRDHFLEMLAFVGEVYGPVLTAEHHAFIARFKGLTQDAQCLLIRMINRRG